MDILPKFEADKPQTYSFLGKRIKRGLYQTSKGYIFNADVNGAYNILRKEIPKFNCKKLNEGIVDWFLPLKINVNKKLNVNS